jgi:hypothetical protein
MAILCKIVIIATIDETVPNRRGTPNERRCQRSARGHPCRHRRAKACGRAPFRSGCTAPRRHCITSWKMTDHAEQLSATTPSDLLCISAAAPRGASGGIGGALRRARAPAPTRSRSTTRRRKRASHENGFLEKSFGYPGRPARSGLPRSWPLVNRPRRRADIRRRENRGRDRRAKRAGQQMK